MLSFLLRWTRTINNHRRWFTSSLPTILHFRHHHDSKCSHRFHRFPPSQGRAYCYQGSNNSDRGGGRGRGRGQIVRFHQGGHNNNGNMDYGDTTDFNTNNGDIVKQITYKKKLEQDQWYHRRSHLWRTFGFIPNPDISIHANTVIEWNPPNTSRGVPNTTKK